MFEETFLDMNIDTSDTKINIDWSIVIHFYDLTI